MTDGLLAFVSVSYLPTVFNQSELLSFAVITNNYHDVVIKLVTAMRI